MRDRLVVAGQVDVEGGAFAGPLLGECLASPGAPVVLRLEPGAAAHDGHLAGAACPCAAAPSATWEVAGRTGPLSAMSFVAAWNEGVREVGGHPLRCDLVDAPTLALPFVAWHPSGTFQLVRFDRGAGAFERRVLYPFAWPEAEGVVELHAAVA